MKSTAWRNPPQPPLVKGDKPHPRIPLDHPSSSPGMRGHRVAWAAGMWRRRGPLHACPHTMGVSPTPHHGPLTQPRVPAAPRARGAGRSSVRVSGRGQGHCYKAAPRPVLPWGGRGPCTTAPQRNQGVPPVSQCKFTESQGTAARPRLCTGEPTGLVRVQRPRSPRACKGEASRDGAGGDIGTVPAVWPAGLVLGIRATVSGGMQRGRAAPGRASSQGWCGQQCGQQRGQPVQRGQGRGAHPGSPRDPAPGAVAAGGDAGGGCSSFSRGFRGGAGGGALSGGCGQPAFAPSVRLPEGSVQLLQLGA